MRRSTYALRLLVAALFALALLTPRLPAQTTTIADAGPASAADDDDDRGDDDDQGRSNSDERRRDPCRNALKHAAKGKRLRPECHPGGSGGAAKGDFNGDGFADLAVGAPHEDKDFVGGTGAVNIIYGSSAGLSETATANQVFYNTTFGFALGSGDHFGSALASGDFNGDTFSDLAIGVPDRNIGSHVNAGVVVLIDGSALGLNTDTARTLSLLAGGRGRAGAALVWADFNGDDFGDLAVGIPERDFQESFFISTDVGEVQVFYGGTNGLTQLGAQSITFGSVHISGSRFGSVLAAGNFHFGSPFADLVFGVPGQDIGGAVDAGEVALMSGSPNGLVGGIQILSQNTPGVGGGAEAGDQFGFALATGDFNADGRDDLAVGVPGEDLTGNTQADAGAVQVFFGSEGAEDLVDAAGDMFISEADLPSLGSGVEAGDLFGWALAVGRFDSDGFDDLAIGLPGENRGSIVDAGVVDVLYGSVNGPSFTRVQTWHQDKPGVPDQVEAGDFFGYALSAWNYGQDSRSDLAIGVPFEGINFQEDAGAVNVIYGSASGLSAAAANTPQFWHQDVSGIQDTAQPGDRFGQVLY